MSVVTATVNADTRNFEAGMGRVNSLLGQLGVLSLRINNILQLTSTAISGVGQMTRSAADTQILQTSFSALLGGGQAASQMLDELRAQALATGRDFKDQADSVRKFLALGFDRAGAMQLNTALLDISGSLGLTNEESKLLAVGLAQVKAKGVASMEELRQQIAEKGVPVFAALQKELGYATTNDLFKAISAGAVSADAVLSVFMDLTGEFERFRGGAQRMAGTWAGLNARIRESGQLAMQGFGQPIIEALSPALEKLIKNQSEVKARFEEIGRVLGGFFSAAAKVAEIAVSFSGVLVPVLVAVALHAWGADKAIAVMLYKLFVLRSVGFSSVVGGLKSIGAALNGLTVAVAVGLAGFMLIQNWTDKLNAATAASLALGAAADKQRNADAARIATIADEASRLEMLADKIEELTRIREEAAEAAAKPGDKKEAEMVAGGYQAQISSLEATIAKLNALTPAQMAAATSAASAADAAREHASALREQEQAIVAAMTAYSDHLRQTQLANANPQQRLDLLVEESGSKSLPDMLHRMKWLKSEISRPTFIPEVEAEKAGKALELHRMIGLHKEILAVQRDIAAEAESRAEKEKREAEALAEKAKATAAYRDRYRLEAGLIDAKLAGDKNAISSAERAVRVSTLSDQLQASGGLEKSEADKIAARQVDKELGLETIENLRQRLRSIQALPPPEMMVIANSARSIGLGGFAKDNEKDVQREIARRHAEGNRILGEIKVILGKLQPSGAKPFEVFSI